KKIGRPRLQDRMCPPVNEVPNAIQNDRTCHLEKEKSTPMEGRKRKMPVRQRTTQSGQGQMYKDRAMMSSDKRVHCLSSTGGTSQVTREPGGDIAGTQESVA
ncbi:neuropathy target esterase sws, partial [Striga asiatica]